MSQEKIAKCAELAVGEGKCVEVAGRRVALFRVAEDEFRAIDDGCTHMGASLADGPLSGDSVVCPWHGARFSLINGAAAGPPARGGVQAYVCRVVGEDVEIAL